MPEKDKYEESFEELFEKEGKHTFPSGDYVKEAGGVTPDITRPVLNQHAAERSDPSWCCPSYGEKGMRRDQGEKAEDRIDLHGDSRDRAFERLDEFLAGCLARGCRLVEVIHGKGENILRPKVRGWLAKCEHVLFYSEVNSNSGSVLVRLRRYGKEKKGKRKPGGHEG